MKRNRLLSGVILTVVAFICISCASPKYATITPELRTQFMNDLKAGKPNLDCDTLACDLSWIYNFNDMISLYNSSQWEKLAELVMKVGYGKDLGYYFLGQAAEGMGNNEAALKYYQQSVTVFSDSNKLHHCRESGGGCRGLDLATLLPQRIAAVKTNTQVKKREFATRRAKETNSKQIAMMSETAKSDPVNNSSPIPSTQIDKIKAAKTNWLATIIQPGKLPIGQPCKKYLASLKLPYHPDKWAPQEMFEIKPAHKLHPDVNTVSFMCEKGGEIYHMTFSSKEYRGKNALLHARQLTDKIIADLHLPENGWKLVESDLDGSFSPGGWRCLYSQTYRRDNIEIMFQVQRVDHKENGIRVMHVNILRVDNN
jgi:hypothetical protein